MWKEIAEKVIESFACADPMGYMYYVASKRESELQGTAVRHQATRDDLPVVRLVESFRAQEEARA